MLTAFGTLCWIENTLEYLTIPAILVLIGLFAKFGWKYYALTIGGYIMLTLFADMIGSLIGNFLGRSIGAKAPYNTVGDESEDTE